MVGGRLGVRRRVRVKLGLWFVSQVKRVYVEGRGGCRQAFGGGRGGEEEGEGRGRGVEVQEDLFLTLRGAECIYAQRPQARHCVKNDAAIVWEAPLRFPGSPGWIVGIDMDAIGLRLLLFAPVCSRQPNSRNTTYGLNYKIIYYGDSNVTSREGFLMAINF